LAFIFGTTFYEQKSVNSKIRNWITVSFGKKPEKTISSFEHINKYWKILNNRIAESQKIDDITWNDLEMNNIYCRINNCTSFAGEQILYAKLHVTGDNEDYNKKIEKQIDYYSNNCYERETAQLLLFKLGKEEISYYLPLFINNVEAFEIKKIWIYRFLQILLFISFTPAIIFRSSALLILPLIVFFVNILIYARKKSQYEIYLNSFDSIIKLVKTAEKILKSNCYDSEDTRKNLIKSRNLFHKLATMIGKIQNKKKASISGDALGLVYDYMLGATLLDFTSYDKVIRILKGKQNEYMELYTVIGELDMAISIASFRKSLPKFCIPTFQNESRLVMEEIYHPLIDEPIFNTITLEKSCIITGSNASGKSTFIKAVTLNIILAQCIHTCMADKMILPTARVITSMAVRDDLMSGESYYIKEIKYLNRIIQSLTGGSMVICAIDEILRGTNTEERIAASASILEYLCDKNCIAIVASHDVELAEIMKTKFLNYHFREQILGNDIMFDYKIHEGAAVSKNAIKLLEIVNFPKEITDRAKQYING
jgi:hypothetical protein